MKEPSDRVMAFLIPIGMICVIGAIIAMAIWPTQVTIGLMVIAAGGALFEKRKKGGKRGTEGSSGAGR